MKSQLHQKIYFPNLNGFRFLAAILVLVHHYEMYKTEFLMSNYFNLPFFRDVGQYAVTFFFVLSGFLITYLLLIEKEKNKTISVKKFYWRRILRIWPLYYFIILLGLLVLPQISVFHSVSTIAVPTSRTLEIWGMYLFFLPNLAFVTIHPMLTFVSATWSIGVEEQFYAFWPVLIKKSKNLWLPLFLVIIIYVFIKVLLTVFASQNEFISIAKDFWHFTRIDCMAIGGIFALLHYTKSDVLKLLYTPVTQVLAVVFTLGMLVTGFKVPFLYHEVYSLVFGIIILNAACNTSTLFKLENKYLNYLGEISYGIYMFHPICVYILVSQFQAHKTLSVFENVALLLAAALLTIATAALSYKYMESYFLKLKSKKEVI